MAGTYLKSPLYKSIDFDYNITCPLTTWGYSSAGRALDWQSRGRRFNSDYLHQHGTQSPLIIGLAGFPFALMSYALSLNTMGLSREIPNASQEAVKSISIS
jgi:hypothetical protein